MWFFTLFDLEEKGEIVSSEVDFLGCVWRLLVWFLVSRAKKCCMVFVMPGGKNTFRELAGIRIVRKCGKCPQYKGVTTYARCRFLVLHKT